MGVKYCNCGLKVFNLNRHLKSQLHLKLLFLKERNVGLYHEALNLNPEQNDYFKKFQRINRYYNQNKDKPFITLPIGE